MLPEMDDKARQQPFKALFNCVCRHTKDETGLEAVQSQVVISS